MVFSRMFGEPNQMMNAYNFKIIVQNPFMGGGLQRIYRHFNQLPMFAAALKKWRRIMTLLQAASYATAAAFVATLMIPVSMLAQAGDSNVRSRDRYPQHVLSLRHQSVAPSTDARLLVIYQQRHVGISE